MSDEMTYDDAGVDRDLGDECSRIAAETCRRTYRNRDGRFGTPGEIENGFSGPVRVDEPLDDAFLVKNSDGVGSKALVAQRTGIHETVAQDLVAMNTDDAVAMGAEPFAATNSLDVKEMDVDLVTALMEGLEDACADAGIAMVGGEIAELGEQITGHTTPYVWNADTIGVVAEDSVIDGSDVAAGDAVVGIRSNGIRSNGLTLARSICRDDLGDAWHTEPVDGSTWGEVLLKPSTVCAGGVLDVIGRYGEDGRATVTGMAHITGGGITNLQRALRSDVGAVLDDLFEPHPEFHALQDRGPVSDREAYRTWNMGQCFLLTTPEPDAVIDVLDDSGLEAKTVGRVTDGGSLTVESRGHESGTLTF
ncbi:MAG: phosphoribosylformylglycinamidine cyclo-ligase [Candidatus Nanohaloarchaea archaeon]